jgi:CheY-like chemotaxis protein
MRISQWALDLLVAEDNPSDVQLFQMALNQCGKVRSLQVVRDGVELLDYLKGNAPYDSTKRQIPNIIFMDLKMPRMDGFDVLHWLRNNPRCSIIPVIVVSSSDLDDDVLRAYRLGANAYFQKPTTFPQLEDILRSVLTFWAHAKRPPVTALPR